VRGLASIELSFHQCNMLRDNRRGVSRENKNVGCGTWKRRFFAVGHRKTETGGYFCRKLTLTRTPDPIRPMRRGPDPNRPSNGKKQGGLWPRGVCPGSFGRTPPETIGDSRTEFNIILCTSKSVAAVTSNKKTALYIEADYRQTRSIARPLCDSWASCLHLYLQFYYISKLLQQNCFFGLPSRIIRPNRVVNYKLATRQQFTAR